MTAWRYGDLLLAEEILLIAFDDRGRDGSAYGAASGPGLAGGLLLDLAVLGAVAEVDGKLTVPAGVAVPRQPLLAAALDGIRAEDRPHDAKWWVARLQKTLKPLRDKVADGLVARGVLAEEHRKALGLFPTTRFPEADPGPERDLRGRLAAVLLDGRDPTPREALLLGMLGPLGLVGGLVPKDVPKDRRKAALERAAAVADQGVAGSAVASTLQDTQAAVLVSIMP